MERRSAAIGTGVEAPGGWRPDAALRRARPALTGAPAVASLLLVFSVLLPCLLMALGGWLAWRQTWRDASAEVQQAAEAVAEFGLRVLSAHAVAAGRVNAMVAGMTDAEIRAREAELHAELRGLLAEMPQLGTSYVIGRHGEVLLTSAAFPAPRGTTPAADRDFFLALREPGAPDLHVSQLHVGRVDGRRFFAVSRRRVQTGNADVPPGGFDGLVNLSIFPNLIAAPLGRIVNDATAVASLVRVDGELLARSFGQDGPVQARGPFTDLAAAGIERAVYEASSRADGVDRLYAARKIDGWPVYAVVGRPRAVIVATWRKTVAEQLAIGVPATILLLALALAMRRAQGRLLADKAGLEAAVAARTAQLAEERGRLEGALEAGRVMAVAHDPAADLVVRSTNAAAILGLPAAIGMRDSRSAFLGAVVAEDRSRLLAALAALTPDSPAYAVRYRYRRPDGSIVWLQDTGAARFGPDGRLVGLTSLSRDVTAEIAADHVMREAGLRLRAAAEGAGIGTYEIDLARGLAWFDPTAAEVLGGLLPAEAWLRLDGPEWAALDAAIHPDDRAAFGKAWDDVVCGEATGWSLETRLRRPDGAWIWEWCHGIALDREAGSDRPRRVVGIMRDVTDRHRMEAELRQGQKLQAVGALAGGIAHDFNNVLQAISGSAALASRDVTNVESLRRRLRAVQDAVARGAAITHRLLAFARPGELRAEPVEPRALLLGLVEILRPALGPCIELRVEAAPALPPLLADREQLQTAIINLATNARDAMPEGGLLTLSARRERIDAAGTAPGLPPGAYIRLDVRDTGAGMDAATLAHVTEPFFTTKPAGKGTGLGLPLVKGFAEGSRGSFAIDSAPGCGTTVSLWLPIVQPSPKALSPDVATPCAGGRATLLLVDDDALVRETLAEELEAEGHTVLTADGSAQALAVLEKTPDVQALVTDLTMPGLDGIALILAARCRVPGLPAVLVTGRAEEAGVPPEAAPCVVLHKPVGAAEVAARVAALLGRA